MASITITEINGIKDIVTFKSKADAILYKFYKTSGNNDTESQKTAIINAASRLVLNDIEGIESTKDVYPSAEEIESMESNQQYQGSKLRPKRHWPTGPVLQKIYWPHRIFTGPIILW